MKKKLIVSGCSFTDKNFWSQSEPNYDCSFPKWPELLAEKLDMDCINLGACGAGNDYIYSTLLEEIIRTPKENIGLVLAAWSQVQRSDWQQYGRYSHPSFSHKDNNNKDMVWRNKRKDKEGDIFYWMLDHLRRIITFDSLCKSKNIPYKQFQMLTPFDAWLAGLNKTDTEIVANLNNPNFEQRDEYSVIFKSTKQEIMIEWNNPNEITNHMLAHKDRVWLLNTISKYEKYMDKKNIIGWPFHENLGGFAIEDKVLMWLDRTGPGTGRLRNNFDLLISDEDGYDYHPNKEGHEKIAEYLYGQLA